MSNKNNVEDDLNLEEEIIKDSATDVPEVKEDIKEENSGEEETNENEDSDSKNLADDIEEAEKPKKSESNEENAKATDETKEVSEEKPEDLEEIQLKDEPNVEAPPTKPNRPERPPRTERKTAQTPKTVAPNGNNNYLVTQLKDAFPSIPTKVLTTIVIAAQNNIESCYDACLFYMNPNEFKPTFHPDNFVPKKKERLSEEELQMKRDEELARDLDRKYNSRPSHSRTIAERKSRTSNGRRSREFIPNENDDSEEDEFAGVQRFIDSDLPMMKENVTKTLKETSSKVGSWLKSFGDNSNELQREKQEMRRKNMNEYDEWGNPVFEHRKSYKIVERSPSLENKVLPQRPIDKTPSKQTPSGKPYIYTPGNEANEKPPNTNQQRSVSGNKRLVFVEPVESSAKARSSIDDDLNLSD
ncbi:uncharacterized protein HGUI_03752 [Hanseniaspora guilliermondii]|uniref:CUE domain-containing protein n=1 Tax=Hanseniaspora guilliermondii TaxID=56406 RepID=A0A1L0D2Z7_9ASCO|nr:uncharacterized protein HGUI_03752 [Hanseniaspora guilliermondii]